jgi:hypothetical protein
LVAVGTALSGGPPHRSVQAQSSEAFAVRKSVEEGATLFKTGTLGKSFATESQFWSVEHPSTPGFAGRYGIPPQNVANADFTVTGRLKPGGKFVTRIAPAAGGNPGGGIEVVVEEGAVQVDTLNTVRGKD